MKTNQMMLYKEKEIIVFIESGRELAKLGKFSLFKLDLDWTVSPPEFLSLDYVATCAELASSLIEEIITF